MTGQVISVLPSSTYRMLPATPYVCITASSAAASRGCSRGRLSASLKAATTRVRWLSAVAGTVIGAWYPAAGAEPGLPGPVKVGLPADLPHLPLDLPGPTLDIGPRPLGAVTLGVGQYRGQSGGLGGRQLTGILAEIGSRGRLGAIDPITELGDVDVHLDDPRLGPHQL